MDIYFVTSHLTVYGGAGIFVMNYANEFNKRGHKVTVIAQRINKEYYKFNLKVDLIEIGGPLPSNPLHWILLRFIRKKFLKVLNKINTGFLISQNFPSNYYCSNIDRNKSIKNIFYCHEPYRYFHDKEFYSKLPIFQRIVCWFLRLFFKRLDIRAALDTDGIICNSNYTKQRVKKCYNHQCFVH